MVTRDCSPLGRVEFDHVIGIIATSRHPALDTTRQHETLHIAVILILKIVAEPPCSTIASTFGRCYKGQKSVRNWSLTENGYVADSQQYQMTLLTLDAENMLYSEGIEGWRL